MIFQAGSVCPKTEVYDVNRIQKIERVIQIDTKIGEVVCAQIPLHVVDGKVATYTLKFRSVHAIYGGSPVPCLFHCYGEIA